MSGTRGLKHLGLALLFVGACSAEKQKATGIDFDPAGYDGFDETHFNLLANDCSFDGNGNMTISVDADETAYLFKRSADGVVVANANYGTAECTVATSKKITITSSNLAGVTDETVIIDFYSGIFGLNSSNTPSLIVTLGAGTGDQLKIRGTPYVDTFTLGTNGATSYAAFQVAPATARTLPDLSVTGVESVTVSTGAANDTITAQGGAALGAGVTALDGAISVVFYGGDDNDTLISGALSSGGARNTLNGGAGNDYFPQQSALASDVIVGGANTDTVDYSTRSNALRVTVGATTAATAATGSITAVAKASIADNDYFELDDGVKTVRFAYQVTPDSAATGSITCLSKALIANNDYFTLDSGAKSYNFEFNATGGGVQAHAPGAFIDISGAADEAAVAVLVQAAIVAAKAGNNLDMTAAAPVGAAIALTNDINGAGTAITDNTTVGSFTLSGMTGGSDFAADVESPENLAASAVIINISAVTTAGQVAAATYTSINTEHTGDTIDITPTNPNGDTVVALTADATGTAANVAIATSVTPNFSVSGMSGGAAIVIYDDGESTEGDSVASDIENVVGGGGADTINASSSAVAHALMGMGGNDTITGAGLADFLYGGAGDDTIVGGAGADFIYGGAANDTLQGGTENDTINGGGVNCVSAVSAGSATTPVVPYVNTTTCSSTVATAPANPGIDTLDYSDRADAVTVDLTYTSLPCTEGRVIGVAGECDVILTTGTGAATVANVRNIRGGSGDDILTGDNQDNIIWAGLGGDIIVGGGGNDALYGEGGNDTVSGGDGNDYVCGGAGTNGLNGNAGLDTVDSSMGTNDTAACGDGDGDISLPGTGVIESDCEL